MYICLWTNLNPIDPGCLCQVWLKLAKWSWRRIWLKYFQSIFVIIYPWKRAWDPSSEELELPSPNSAKFGSNWPCGWKCEKRTRQTDGRQTNSLHQSTNVLITPWRCQICHCFYIFISLLMRRAPICNTRA